MPLPDPRYRVTMRRRGASCVVATCIQMKTVETLLRTTKGPEWSTWSILDFETGEKTHGEFPWTRKKREPASSLQLSLL